MRTKSVNYNNHSIFYIDFSNLKDYTAIDQVAKSAATYIRSKPEKSILAVTNIENMHFNSDIRKILSDLVSGNKPYIKASAIVGMSSLQKIIYNGVMSVTQRKIRSCKTKEEAMNWLVQY